MSKRRKTNAATPVPPIRGSAVKRGKPKSSPLRAGDPVTPKNVRAVASERKKQFDAAHKKGMAALKRHDFRVVGEVIEEERRIIEEQAAIIDATRMTFGTARAKKKP